MLSEWRELDIGIVTAVPIECFAVQLVMDDLQEVSAPDAEDWSSYYIGTMPSRVSDRPHRVVLCLLTEDGGVAAAHGCANLARTWAVRHIVMCGIACGVPNLDEPERHVRLGDVLVAEDGVVPYNHVRVNAEGEELRRPAARPSVVLRNAARRLRTGEEEGRRPWEPWLDEPHRRGLTEYFRPPESTDILFDDETGKRQRHPPLSRSRHRRGRPKIHYGLIGSGGKLIRTSVERNRLARKHRLIGLDMEGDGVSDAAYLQGVDWFMVRGVSDYGSRKDDTWHRYAALAAAAYTRLLLGQMSPSTPQKRTPRSGSGSAAQPPGPLSAEREMLSAALLDIRTMRDRAGRDQVVAGLPESIRSKVPRRPEPYSDIFGIVNFLSREPAGLRLLLAELRAVEGDSMPVQRFADLIDS